MVFAHYGPFWRQMRKLCVMKLFSRRRPGTWLAVRDESAALVRAVARRSGDPVNLGDLIFNLSMNVTFRAAFGAEAAASDGDGRKQDEIIAIMQEFSKLFGAFSIGDFIPWLGWADPQGINVRLRAARTALDEFIDKIIDEHIKRGKNPDDMDADMVDGMLAFLPETKPEKTAGDDLQNTLRLNRDNIKAIILDVMFGGTETVASAIEWAMAEMMHSPDDLLQLQQELADTVGLGRNVDESDLNNLSFLKCVIKETLRLHPSIPLLHRENARGMRGRQLLRAPGLERQYQRLRHGPRHQVLERRRHIPSVAVHGGGRGGSCGRLQGRVFPVPAVWVWSSLVPRDGARPVLTRARYCAARPRV
ncbi:hypothetical protein VPH35_000271 [Triticum aestivum]